MTLKTDMAAAKLILDINEELRKLDNSQLTYVLDVTREVTNES